MPMIPERKAHIPPPPDHRPPTAGSRDNNRLLIVLVAVSALLAFVLGFVAAFSIAADLRERELPPDAPFIVPTECDCATESPPAVPEADAQPDTPAAGPGAPQAPAGASGSTLDPPAPRPPPAPAPQSAPAPPPAEPAPAPPPPPPAPAEDRPIQDTIDTVDDAACVVLNC